MRIPESDIFEIQSRLLKISLLKFDFSFHILIQIISFEYTVLVTIQNCEHKIVQMH